MKAELTWEHNGDNGVLWHTRSGRVLANRITLDDAARSYPGFVITARKPH